MTFAIFHVLRCRYLEIISRTPHPPQISFKIHEIISRSFHLTILRGVPQVLSQPSPPLFKRPQNELLLRLEGTDDPNCNSSLQNRNHWFSPLVLYRCLAPLVLHMPVSRWDKCIFFTWDEASKASSYPYISLNYIKQLWNLSESFGFFLVISEEQICALRVAICI